ncbi:histone deacetylase family protein [Aureimonas fodinaquatilis]|nr:histone deacetylase family protein [Aureimonas fodinaquatilis]
MVHGRIVEPLENPSRLDTLIAALKTCGAAPKQPEDAGLGPILAVHCNSYVAFLQTAYEKFTALPNAGPEVLPNVHPYMAAPHDGFARALPRTTGILGLTGWYIGDLSCAMMARTYEAAYASAQSAIAAADDVLRGADAAFALCRPPGHHAYRDRASGFCFLNNAAIAAQRLRDRFGKVAIVDFDTHHGDGTQAIFYNRSDVFFASTHTDPASYYPHYYGYDDEIGQGEGEGYNLNLPLAPGSGDRQFVEAVRRLADRVTAYGAEALVLSAGWDAHRDDPLSRLDVSTAAYHQIGEILAELGLPTVIVQEGGYSLSAVAEVAPTFLTAFQQTHHVR